MAGSDFSCPFVMGYGSSPPQCGPARRETARPDVRPPRFRRRLFARDGVFDCGRATAPRMTAPYMLPSTLLTASAPAIFWLSQLNSPPRRNRCVRFATAVADSHATLATGRPLQLTRTGLSPARRRQLTGAQAIQGHRRCPTITGLLRRFAGRYLSPLSTRLTRISADKTVA